MPGSNVDREGDELGYSSDLIHPGGGRNVEGSIRNHGFDILDGLDDTSVEIDDGFGGALGKVGERDSGGADSANGGVSFEEGCFELIINGNVDVGSFEGEVPEDGLASECIENVGHCASIIPIGRSSGVVDSGKPVFSNKGVGFSVAGESW